MAYFVIDCGFDHHLQWVCFIEKTGECWTFRNPDVRLSPNVTEGRLTISKIGGADAQE